MNKLIEELKEYKNTDERYCINRNVNDFMDLIYQNELYDYTDSIFDENDMVDRLKRELDKGNWATVRDMLSGIRDINESYYFQDGYGNFNNVLNQDINSIVDDIVNDYQKSCKEDYDL